MSEKGKEIIARIMEAVPTLEMNEQNYVLGVAEGMAFARESNKTEQKETSAHE